MIPCHRDCQEVPVYDLRLQHCKGIFWFVPQTIPEPEDGLGALGVTEGVEGWVRAKGATALQEADLSEIARKVKDTDDFYFQQRRCASQQIDSSMKLASLCT